MTTETSARDSRVPAGGGRVDTLDAQGRVIRTEFDDDRDGTGDRIESYARNINGNIISIDYDDNGDGVVERQKVFHRYSYGPLDMLSGCLLPGIEDDLMTSVGTLDANGRLVRIDIDFNGDDVVDSVKTYTRDAAGNVLRIDFDRNADGTVDRAERYTRDANGNAVQVGFDDDGDGTADRVENYARNFDGDIIRTDYDNDGNGAVDRTEHFTLNLQTAVDNNGDGVAERIGIRAWDARRNLVLRSILRIEHDDDRDGATDRSEIFTRDGAGDIIRVDFDDDMDGVIDRTGFDDNEDGTVDRIESYAGDHDNVVNRFIFRAEFDDDADGAADRIEHYSRDVNGHIIRTDFDDDADGVVNRIEVYTRALNARIIRTDFNNAESPVIRTDFDDDADGAPDRVRFDPTAAGVAARTETLERDANGNLIREYFDDDADGVVNRIRTYEYNANGDLLSSRIRTEYDDDADGYIDRSISRGYVETYERDAGGRIIRTEFSRYGDSAAYRIVTHVRDANGHIIRTDTDSDADGAVNHAETFTRDANGRITRAGYDNNADGTAERIETYERDANGEVIRAGYDDDGDGTAERIKTYVRDANGKPLSVRTDYDDDDDGRIDRVRHDDNGNGVVDRTEAFSRDGNGGIVRIDSDDDVDGYIDRVRFDPGADGTVDRIETFTRDGNGGLTRIDFDDNGDERVDRSRFFAGSSVLLAAVDVEWHSKPTFADLDGDGDLDLLVGGDGDGDELGIVHYYRNDSVYDETTGGLVGALLLTVLEGVNNPFNDVNADGEYDYSRAAPALADLDGDGDLDLAVGRRDGGIGYYENTGSVSIPTFAERTGAGADPNPFHGIDVSRNSTPALADLDGDGDLDLAVGGLHERLHYFENTGSAEAPVFSERTSVDNPFHDIGVLVYAAPAFTDLDGDGDLDLAVGGVRSGHGELHVHYFENTGNAEAPAFKQRTDVTGVDSNPFYGLGALEAAPAFGDLDGDQAPELVFGMFEGDLLYHRMAVERTETYVRNEDGVVVQTDFDDNADGTVDRTEFDDNADGTVDRTETHVQNSESVAPPQPPEVEAAPPAVAPPQPPEVEAAPPAVAPPQPPEVEAAPPAVAPPQPEVEAAPPEDSSPQQSEVEAAPPAVSSPQTSARDSRVQGEGGGRVDAIPPAVASPLSVMASPAVANGVLDWLDIYTLNAAGNRIDVARYDFPLSYEATAVAFFNAIGVDAYAVPAFADLDGDGDLDLAVGSLPGHVHYFENTGNATAPAFTSRASDTNLNRNPFYGMDAGYDAAPTFADMDDDGDLDLVVGNSRGDISYYENTGSATAAAFALQEGAANPFAAVDVVNVSSPVLVDLDGDGDLDLVVGNFRGAISYYENTGDAENPTFGTASAANPFAGINVGAYAAPAFTDRDGDGDWDLVAGWNGGALRYYENTGSASVPAFTERTGGAGAHPNPFYGIVVEGQSAPTFADLDGDFVPELVVGAAAGALKLHQPVLVQNATYTLNAARDVVRADFDDDADGTADRAESYARDDQGNIIRVDFDDDADGTVDRSEAPAPGSVASPQPPGVKLSPGRIEIDDDRDGYADRVYFDANGVGAVDRVEVYARNAQGGIIQTGFDDDADGHVDRAHFDPNADGTADRIESYTRDSGGRVTRTAFDDAAAGTAERIESYTRDSDGRVARTAFDDDADGAAERIESYGRDNGGRVIRTAFDDDADGAAESIKTYVRNSAGEVIQTGIDSDADGIVNRREFDGDADGAAERIEIDDDDDGAVDRVEFDANENGTAERTEYDDDGDGAADRIEFDANENGTAERTGYDDDGDGRIDRAELDADEDGAVERTESYLRNHAGGIVQTDFDDDLDGRADRTRFDPNADGSAERTEAYARDANGNITRTDFDDDADGTTDRAEIYARDVVGDVARTDFDDDADGTIDRTEIRLRNVKVDYYAAPAFADLDGDGDLDLVVGERLGKLHYFENTGGVAPPAFMEWTGAPGAANPNPFYGIDVGSNAAPVFADLDGDGDLDLAAGRNKGQIRYYKNTGSVANPVFEEQTGTADSADPNPFHGFDAGSRSVPTFADLDGDGDLDLVVGSNSDGIRYYKNTGSARLPVFTEQTGAAGSDNPNPFQDIDVGAGAAPTFMDADRDGDWDLVVGNLVGVLKYYENTGSAAEPTFEARTDADNPFNRLDAGSWSAPVFADLGGEAALEFVAGIKAGSVFYHAFASFQPGIGARASKSVAPPPAAPAPESPDAGMLSRPLEVDENKDGHIDRAYFDADGNGALDRIEIYLRDINGNVIRTDFDDEADETIDRAAFDDEGDGTVDRIETYSYDAHGNLVKKVMAVSGEDEGDAPAAEPEGPRLGRSAADGPGARGVAGKETVAAGAAGARTPFESMLEDLGGDVVIRSETYTRNAAGAVVRTDYDEGDDGIVERSSVDEAGDGVIDEHRYDHDANGEPDWVGRDSDNDGMMERLEFHGQWGAAGNPVVHTITLLGAGPAYAVAFHDGDGLLLASGWSVAGPGALDGFAYSADLAVVSELQTATTTGVVNATLPVDATLLAGVAHIDLAGAGAGSTDLTLSAVALAVLADGDGNYQLRIDGDGDDTLRFDLDEFTRGDDIAVDGEDYEQYAGTTGSFIVDPDVTLVTA